MKSSTANIADQFDDEGLISNSSLKWDGRQLLLTSGEKVWVKPIVRGVAEILRSRPDLWRIAKLHVDSKDWISARAPFFGVPFDVALRQLLAVRRLQNRPIKIMFQRVDSYDLESNRTGIVATMVAHLSFDVGTAGPEITLEMWQIPNVEAETFYIHGIFLPEERCFVHLDGATMYHDANGVDRLFRYGKKTKGYQKEKHFRLDWPINVNDARVLGTAFLPLEDLSAEYSLMQHGGGDAQQIVGPERRERLS